MDYLLSRSKWFFIVYVFHFMQLMSSIFGLKHRLLELLDPDPLYEPRHPLS
jgi:hypothetical protein